MSLCDQLEQQQADSDVLRQTLVEILLNTLNDAADQSELEPAWQRIANHFDTLFINEYSIDQLKRTILQLAVIGKLVPQNPNDEPASVLLEKIAKEKARLVKEGKIKKEKPLPKIGEDEKPFELPVGWEWIRLGSAGLCSTGKTPSTGNSHYYDGEIPFIGPGQISESGTVTETDKTLTKDGRRQSVTTKPNDILMVCIGGSIGKSALVRSRIAFNQQINCIRPLHIDSNYLYVVINAPHFQSSILESATGSATPIINRSKWERLLISIPPLSEQHRIVAEVDELMAVCDTIKVRLNEAQTTQIQLADTIIKRVVTQQNRIEKDVSFEKRTLIGG